MTCHIIISVVTIKDYLGMWNQMSPYGENEGFLVCNRIGERKLGMKWVKGIDDFVEISYTINGDVITCDVKPSIVGKFHKAEGFITWHDSSELYKNWVRRGRSF